MSLLLSLSVSLLLKTEPPSKRQIPCHGCVCAASTLTTALVSNRIFRLQFCTWSVLCLTDFLTVWLRIFLEPSKVAKSLSPPHHHNLYISLHFYSSGETQMSILPKKIAIELQDCRSRLLRGECLWASEAWKTWLVFCSSGFLNFCALSIL